MATHLAREYAKDAPGVFFPIPAAGETAGSYFARSSEVGLGVGTSLTSKEARDAVSTTSKLKEEVEDLREAQIIIGLGNLRAAALDKLELENPPKTSSSSSSTPPQVVTSTKQNRFSESLDSTRLPKMSNEILHSKDLKFLRSSKLTDDRNVLAHQDHTRLARQLVAAGDKDDIEMVRNIFFYVEGKSIEQAAAEPRHPIKLIDIL